MSAPASESGRFAPLFASFAAALVLICAAVPVSVNAQAPASSQPSRSVTAPAPVEPVDGRFALQVLAAPVDVHIEPALSSAVIAQLQQSAKLESDQRRGTWYRVSLSDGRSETYDLVVGADGVHSAVRRLGLGGPAARYAGQSRWRFVARGSRSVSGPNRPL